MAVITFVYPPPGSISISGGATEAKQDVMITSLGLLDDAISTTGSAVPTKSNQVSGTDGTNARVLKTDSSGELQIDVLSSALPTGAATESTLSTLNGKVTAVNTGAVVISSSALPTGAATESTLSSLNGKVTAVNTGAVVISSSALPTGASTETTLAALEAKVPSGLAVAGGLLQVEIFGTAGASQSGTWTVQPGNSANTTAWLVNEEKSATSTVTSVSAATSSTSLLASASGRKHATFYNDSTAILYLKLGATASTSSYTVQLGPNDYYELPSGRIYTGAIDGIWSAATGAVRITELS